MLNIKETVSNISEEVIKWRRTLHEYPELSFNEYKTSSFIKEILKEIKVDSIKNIGETGVLAEVYGTKEGVFHCIGFRADMDALPGRENSGLEFSSKVENVVHSCGHDVHTAILLGFAKLLTENRNCFCGCVKLFFQQAEEVLGGGKIFIEEGVMDNPKVENVVALHVYPPVDVGKISVKYGRVQASSDRLNVTVYGKQAHAAYPHNGVDSIVITAYIITSLQTLISREIAPTDSAVITFGKINAGIAHNIISESVSLEGTIRTLNMQTRNKIHKRVKELIEGIASSMGGSAKIEIDIGNPPLINSDRLVDKLIKVGKDILGEENVLDLEAPTMGGEDFAFFMEKAPGLYFRLGVKSPDKYETAVHTLDFYADEKSISVGMEVFLALTIDELNGL